MSKKKNQRYVYVNINEYTIMLILICDVLGISKYQMILLYEVFGNDVFLIFDIFQKGGYINNVLQYRIKKCMNYAKVIESVCKGNSIDRLSTTQLRAYKVIANLLYENKLKIAEDIVM